MLGQLAVDGIEHAFAGARLDQPLLEDPDGCAVRDLARMPQAGEALKAQPVQKLEFHLFVRQVEQLLDQQDPHHHFGRKGRAAAAFAARTRRCPINCRGQRGEVDMPLQQFERVAQLR